MKLVNILISTYNGEKYIEEQLDSILNQSYPNIKIYIRDDGSTDRTVEIIKNYQYYNKIVLLEGENIGYGASFMTLLKFSDEGEFWAFCDQDDIWDELKIEKAISKLKEMNNEEPNMYSHNFILTDENLNGSNIYKNHIKNYSFRMAITECLHLGFATVINLEFRKLMLKCDCNLISSHDWWAELIAMEFGNIYTDDYIGAKHRRLQESVSDNRMNNRIKWLVKALRGNSEIHNITKYFLNVFGNDMKENDRIILSWFVDEKYNIVKAIKKSFYYKRWRTSLSSEIVLRGLMLLGKI